MAEGEFSKKKILITGVGGGKLNGCIQKHNFPLLKILMTNLKINAMH